MTANAAQYDLTGLLRSARDVILGNIVGGGVPDAVVTENVLQSLVEMLRSVRAPDIVPMKRKAHHAPVFRTFSIERVELVFDHLQEVICLTIPGQHAGIIGLAGIGNVDELLSAPYASDPRNRKFLRVMAMPRNARSATLLSIASRPSLA